MESYDFERVSPTALGPVIGRGEYSDIPFAREVMAEVLARVPRPSNDLLPADFLNGLRGHAPFFEARFKAVSRLLSERKATQIVELAAGYSPRALDPAFRETAYVEVDLPRMIEQKREIVVALLGAIPAHLQFCCASVLNGEELAQGLAHLGNAPVAFTCEGLLRYLTFEEKTVLAANVRHFLGRYGGVWITPDIHLREWARERTPKEGFDWNFTKQLGRDVNPNYFDDLPHARAFFEGCGFQVEDRPLLEGIRKSIVSLPLASPELLAQLESRRIFVLTAR